MFAISFWLFGCSISRSNPNRRRRCTFALPRPAAFIFSANVEVHLRRTLCDVRWNVLLAPIIHRLFPASAHNRFRAVVAVRIAPVEGPLVVQLPYILSQRQRSPAVHLVRRTVQRLVGLFIWFSAVLPWPSVFHVTVSSLFFALSMWKVHCTCGNPLFLCPTSAFTLGALCAP